MNGKDDTTFAIISLIFLAMITMLILRYIDKTNDYIKQLRIANIEYDHKVRNLINEVQRLRKYHDE